MTHGSMARALNDIRRLAEAADGGGLTDRQLLERFAGGRDEDAFALLVRRHGPMVLSVCRRVLRHTQDAEDAFQAAFLVLARKAGSVRWHDSAGGWLFQVAYHLALKMRAGAARRRTQPLREVAGPDQPDAELVAVLDEELGRLPEKYRAALLLCLYEGKTRAEAARLLGWKEGAVKIRLERGRELLRTRLARRGAVLGALATSAATVPPALAGATAAAARGFALGQLAAGASRPVTLAEGVLRTMMLTRIKIAALMGLALTVVLLGAGLGAYRAFAVPPDEAAEARAKAPVRRAWEPAPAPVPEPEKPLRVLLFAGAPTREYQFVRSLFVRRQDKGQAAVSISLQTGGAKVVQDVPPDRMLKEFPTRFEPKAKKEDGDEKYDNLAEYDLLLAFDPDWSKLTEEQLGFLEKWVGEEGHGLVFVAGPVNTNALARAANARALKPILDLLPVRVEDSRLAPDADTGKPHALAFPATEKFLKLDEEGKGALAGWSEFFYGERLDDWQKTDRTLERGFYVAYPVRSVKPAATVLATVRDGKPQSLPYLVVMPYGKGKTVYLGSGETWRLRQYRERFHERFWEQLARDAASAGGAGGTAPGPRAPAVTPGQRKAADKGLAWLAGKQARDGHWEAPGGQNPVSLTALSGMALLMQGSTVGEGEYADHIRKAVDWLMSRSQPNGLIGKRGAAAESDAYVSGHAEALLFLASVFGEDDNAERRRRLQDLLTRAVEFTVKAQTSGGGWGRLSGGTAKEKDDRADVAATVLQLRALRAARAAGIDVPKETISRGLRYLGKTIEPKSPEAIAALAGAFGAGEHQSADAKKWLGAAAKSAPALDATAGRPADHAASVYAFALVAYFLGDEGYAKLFPESKPAERITWGEFRKKAFDYLLKTQDAAGGWGDDVRATALYLAVLQLDYGAVPFYQR